MCDAGYINFSSFLMLSNVFIRKGTLGAHLTFNWDLEGGGLFDGGHVFIQRFLQVMSFKENNKTKQKKVQKRT